MPVFSRDGVHILYIHVPKTGGTSIEFLFERNGFKISYLDRGGADSLNHVTRSSPQHMCRLQLEALFNLTKFKYIFMTVREPYARFISTFTMHHAERETSASFDSWAQNSLKRLVGGAYLFDNHLRPQADFYVSNAEVFKQEHGYGEQFVARLAEKIGCKFTEPSVKRYMASDKHKADELTMSEATKAVVRVIYARDFQQFGYQA